MNRRSLRNWRRQDPTPEPTYSPPPADTEILITAVGDCTLGGDNEYGLEDRFRKYYDQYGADYFFSGARNCV